MNPNQKNFKRFKPLNTETVVKEFEFAPPLIVRVVSFSFKVESSFVNFTTFNEQFPIVEMHLKSFSEDNSMI